MKRLNYGILLSSVLISTLVASPKDDARVESLEKEVASLKAMMLELKKSNDELREIIVDKVPTTSFQENKKVDTNELAQLKSSVEDIRTELEGNEKSGFQLAGYASFGWSDAQGSGNSFDLVQFSPIFHYQYSNIFQFEGELEITVNDKGETVTELEYAAGNLYLNDYMTLMFGKFMSPLGQFVQNQHPAWINKLPSKPLGFGHDGAAPTSYVGVSLRGGLPKIANTRSNYALFVANAPVFGLAADGDVIIDATGKTTSNGTSKTFGGRFAINPISSMEVGLSLAKGKASETLTSGGNIDRDYDVSGLDFMYNINAFDIKAEYIAQKIGENSASPYDGGVWRAMYAQLSYQFSNLKLEPVIRYSDYHNPEQEKNQLAIGLNYLFSNNVIGKIGYEFNKDEDTLTVNSAANNDRILAQFAFGF